MKKKALIQAIILFSLMAGTWVLLIVKFQEGNNPKEETDVSSGKPPHVIAPEIVSPSGDPIRPVPSEAVPSVIPPLWQPWADAFAAANSPEHMRAIIQELEADIFTMQPAEAIAFINEFLESGADVRTGLAFQTGRDGELVGAGHLRAILLDWLFQLDPEQAAAMARKILRTSGTDLTPDEYVIHMRNYRLGTTDSSTSADAFLKDRFIEMIQHEPWMRDPVSAVAKAFEAAVVTEATELIPRFTELMDRNRPQLLRNAAAVTVERLVDRAPLAAVEALIADTADRRDVSLARAGYIARLDPAMPGASALFNAYLDAPGVRGEEIDYFLRSFPNLNQTVSYPLFRNYISSTKQVDYITRFKDALQQVRLWREDPRMEPFLETLDTVEANLSRHLREFPSP